MQKNNSNINSRLNNLYDSGIPRRKGKQPRSTRAF